MHLLTSGFIDFPFPMVWHIWIFRGGAAHGLNTMEIYNVGNYDDHYARAFVQFGLYILAGPAGH
jgi:hypothetical protein